MSEQPTPSHQLTESVSSHPAIGVDAILFRPEIYEAHGLPDYKTGGSAGMDLRACINEPVTLKPNETAMVPSGLKIHVANPDYAAILLPRSGLGAKEGIVLGNLVGLIDSDYQGEMGMCVWNRSNKEYTIQPGDRVAQMVVIKVEQVRMNWVDSFDATERGEGGFGSTGVRDNVQGENMNVHINMVHPEKGLIDANLTVSGAYDLQLQLELSPDHHLRIVDKIVYAATPDNLPYAIGTVTS